MIGNILDISCSTVAHGWDPSSQFGGPATGGAVDRREFAQHQFESMRNETSVGRFLRTEGMLMNVYFSMPF